MSQTALLGQWGPLRGGVKGGGVHARWSEVLLMDELPDPRHQRFLEWLTTYPHSERSPRTKAALAEALHVNVRTLRDWEVRDDFQKAHAERARFITGSAEKVQEVLEALHETAKDRSHRSHVQAAKEWLVAVGAVSPQPKVSSDGGAKALTTEELDRLIGARALEEAQSRGLRLAAVNGEVLED